MTRFFVVLAAMVPLLLSGCADSLTVPDARDAANAPYSPNPVGHIPAARQQNPLGNDAPPF